MLPPVIILIGLTSVSCGEWQAQTSVKHFQGQSLASLLLAFNPAAALKLSPSASHHCAKSLGVSSSRVVHQLPLLTASRRASPPWLAMTSEQPQRPPIGWQTAKRFAMLLTLTTIIFQLLSQVPNPSSITPVKSAHEALKPAISWITSLLSTMAWRSMAPTITFFHAVFLQFSVILDPVLYKLGETSMSCTQEIASCAQGLIQPFVLVVAAVRHHVAAWLKLAWHTTLVATADAHKWFTLLPDLNVVFSPAISGANSAFEAFETSFFRLASWHMVHLQRVATGPVHHVGGLLGLLHGVLAPPVLGCVFHANAVTKSFLDSGFASWLALKGSCVSLASVTASWLKVMWQDAVATVKDFLIPAFVSWLGLTGSRLGAAAKHAQLWCTSHVSATASSLEVMWQNVANHFENFLIPGFVSWLVLTGHRLVAAAKHLRISCASLVSATVSLLEVMRQNVVAACSPGVSATVLMMNRLRVALSEHRAISISVLLMLCGLTVYGPRQRALGQHAETILVLESLSEIPRLGFVPPPEVVNANASANTLAQLVMDVGLKAAANGRDLVFNRCTRELGSAVLEFGKAAFARSDGWESCKMDYMRRVESALYQFGNFSVQISEAANEGPLQEAPRWHLDVVHALQAIERKPWDMQRELLKLRFKPLTNELKLLGLDDMLPESIDGSIIRNAFNKSIDVLHPDLAVPRQLQELNKTQYDIEIKHRKEKQAAVRTAYIEVLEAWTKSKIETPR